MLINNLQTTILEHLGRFGFLTVSLFQMLTGKSEGYIREMLGSLSRTGYIKSYRVDVSYKMKSESMYMLTPVGQEFLVSLKNVFPSEVLMPVGSGVVVRDFFHRYNYLKVQISLYLYCEAHQIPITFFASYFTKTGSARKSSLTAKTRIPLTGSQYYIPDGVMKTENSLYLIEMYCDKDTKRILTQLGTHSTAIGLGTPAKTFNLAVNAKVLSVFSSPGMKKAVIKRLTENEAFTAPMRNLFFFATLEDLKDCNTAWHTIDGTPLQIN